MPFKKVGSLDPHGGPILRTALLGNSVQAVIGRSVDTTNGGSLQLTTLGALVYGHIDGIVNKEGMTPTVNGNNGDFTMFYLTASTNVSSAQYKAQCDISKFSLYSVDPDADIGSTYGSNKLGYHTEVVTGGDETSESSAIVASAQYFIHGVDPADSGNQIVNIKESTIFGGA